MTREEIIRLRQRELNAAIARHIFEHDVQENSEPPNYLADPVAAFRAIEKLGQRGWGVKLVSRNRGWSWICIWYSPQGEVMAVEVESTVPEAVFRAALMAILPS